MHNHELAPAELYQPCRLEGLSFDTTSQLEALPGIIGQPRAIEALRFGVEITQPGYNIFAAGPQGSGARELILELLKQRASGRSVPDDWCYVYNFDQPHRPVAINLPPGVGRHFRDDMDRTVEDMQIALAAAFDSEEYRRLRHELEEEFANQQKQTLSGLREKAQERGLAMIETPVGFALTPADEQGNPMTPDQVQRMSDEERASFAERGEAIEREAKEIMQKAPRVHREMHERERQLQRETAARALEPLFAELRRRYDQPAVVEYLRAVEEDACENYKDILSTREKHPSNHSSSKENGQPQSAARHLPPPLATDGVLRRYRVNLLVEREPGAQGAPVHYEDHPSFCNIAGRVDYMVQMGTLVTDFNLIKPGALHKANGGYLVMDALKLLMQPLVWEALKRSIRAGQARLETPQDELGLFHTVSLEPEPIPMDLTIVLLGSPLLYHLLLSADPDFGELFKVVSDFGSDIERTPESEALYARMIATFIQKDKLLPFDRAAVQRVIERNSRIIGDAGRLSARIEAIRDLLREAHYWARHAGQEVVHDEHVERAIEAQGYRSDRVRERIGEEIQRGTILIETDGARIGQVNALSVFAFGDFLFGRPSKVTARTRAGRGEFIDIERAVTLGEPIHSKGVLILRGFLAGRYARNLPLSLSASLVFEQSYGPVEGDSASLAELCALLSSIAEAPVQQSMAITGSVDQQGDVQPVGAINEKIEGFFDVCRTRGLTGDQGVILPAANVQHLMLRKDVIDAVANGRFHLYPVSSVDEAAEALTGMPPQALNGRVSANLEKYASERRRMGPNGEQEAEETPEFAELLKV